MSHSPPSNSAAAADIKRGLVKIRLRKVMHDALRREAKARGMTLNAVIEERLERAFADWRDPDDYLRNFMADVKLP